MADHETLNVGDVVSHPDWPEGETHTILQITQLRHPHAIKKGNPRGLCKERVIHLDASAMDTNGDLDDAWMEAGLVKVNCN